MIEEKAAHDYLLRTALPPHHHIRRHYCREAHYRTLLLSCHLGATISIRTDETGSCLDCSVLVQREQYPLRSKTLLRTTLPDQDQQMVRWAAFVTIKMYFQLAMIRQLGAQKHDLESFIQSVAPIYIRRNCNITEHNIMDHILAKIVRRVVLIQRETGLLMHLRCCM